MPNFNRQNINFKGKIESANQQNTKKRVLHDPFYKTEQMA
jgi:hypothetical protein